ncbi:hypothetical protein ACFYE2_04320 [Kocuria sp. CPCC 205300]|uniref:hypothetical protein n=1 Tax=Kocuria sabuli TaxID=3071448 RepID=UPI0036D8BD6E
MAASSDRPGTGARSTSPGWWLAVVAAVALQLLVLFLTLVMGLGWGGWSHVLAMLQALLALVLIVLLTAQRRWAVLAVPLVSGALTAGLAALGVATAPLTECGEAEESALAELSTPAGQPLEPDGRMEFGCYAEFGTDLSLVELQAHYGPQLQEEGWQVEVLDEPPLPGPEEERPSPEVPAERLAGGELLTASRDGLHLTAELVQEFPQDPGRVRFFVTDDDLTG